MRILKFCLLLSIFLSFPVLTQVKSVAMEKELLKKLSQNKPIEVEEIKYYLQSFPDNKLEQVQHFQQKYQDQLQDQVIPSDDPMTNEMQSKDMERKLDEVKEQFEKANLELKKDCSLKKEKEISDLNFQVKKICQKVKR